MCFSIWPSGDIVLLPETQVKLSVGERFPTTRQPNKEDSRIAVDRGGGEAGVRKGMERSRLTNPALSQLEDARSRDPAFLPPLAKSRDKDGERDPILRPRKCAQK